MGSRSGHWLSPAHLKAQFQQFRTRRRHSQLYRWGLAWRLPLLTLVTFGLCLVAMPALTQPGLEITVPQVAEVSRSATDLLEQGRAAYRAGRFADAATLWQQASDRFQQQNDRRNQAIALSNLALANQQLGQWSPAAAALTKSFALIGGQDPKQVAAEDRPLLAQALNTQGSLQLTQGNAEAALAIWQQAERVYNQFGDQRGAQQAILNQAQALQAMGLYRTARSILEPLAQQLQNQTPTIAAIQAQRVLGDTFRVLGDLERSREILQQSLALARQLNDPAEQSATLFSLGNTARSQQDAAAALTFYRQAEALAQTPLIQIQAQLNQLSLLIPSDPKVAIDAQSRSAISALIPKIQAALLDLPASRSGIFAQINYVSSLIRLDQAISSVTATDLENLLARSIQQARQIQDPRAESYAQGTLGRLYELNQQGAQARQVTEQALLLAQASNADDITYQWQWQLGRLLERQNQTEPAIAAYDRAVTILQSLRSDLASTNPDVQFSFRETVEPVYRQYISLLLKTDQKSSPSQQNIRKARSVMESLQQAELENFFQEACLDVRPVQIDQVDPKAGVVYPIILPDRIDVILSLPGKPLQHHSRVIPQNEFEQTVDDLRQSLSPIARLRDRLRLAQQVYDWLIEPAEAALQASGVETLIFVPDGVLRNLPMTALYDGEQFLVERYNIAITPGLELFEPKPLAQGQLDVLLGGLTEGRQGFSALPGVGEELARIQTQVPNTLLLNQELTNQNLSRNLAQLPFNIVHLATHGQFSSKAEDTFILTWDDRINVKELDSLLRSRGRNEAEPLELLVLSACQTASGDRRAALGLAGVAVRSGARSTIATLWSVNDDAASAVMARFYQALVQPGVTKAQALRQAQLALLNDPAFRAPYYWAPFVLVGNWL